MDYEIIRSARKTLAIEITRDARVVVRAPLKCPLSKIQLFVEKHSSWIEKHLEKAKAESQKKTLSKQETELLRQKAKSIIPKKVEYYSSLMGLYPTGIKITSAKSRYGSCSAKNALCFSLYLMLESDEFINYVVVHELSHIKYKNHSKEFHAFCSRFAQNPKKTH